MDLTLPELKTEFKYYFDQGLYYGYPVCCIVDFITNMEKRAASAYQSPNCYTEPQLQIADMHTGFVPCPTCAKNVVDGKIKLQELLVNRKANFAFSIPKPSGKFKNNNVITPELQQMLDTMNTLFKNRYMANPQAGTWYKWFETNEICRAANLTTMTTRRILQRLVHMGLVKSLLKKPTLLWCVPVKNFVQDKQAEFYKLSPQLKSLDADLFIK